MGIIRWCVLADFMCTLHLLGVISDNPAYVGNDSIVRYSEFIIEVLGDDSDDMLFRTMGSLNSIDSRDKDD